MFAWIDRLPLTLFVVAALTLGLAPFVPEPHLWEKLRMLAQGELVRPIDIFDLILHATPWLLLAIKVARSVRTPKAARLQPRFAGPRITPGAAWRPHPHGETLTFNFLVE
jgi:hypothetical protein